MSRAMPRTILLLAVVCLASACQIPTLLEPAPGALRVRGVMGQGDLFLDSIDRGPVQSVQLFGGLAPGAHVIELRRDGVVVAAHVADVRPGMVLDTRIDAPIASPASAPVVASTERARNTPPRSHDLEPSAAPAPDPAAASAPLDPDPIATPAMDPGPIAAPAPDDPIAAARPTTSDGAPRSADTTARSTRRRGSLPATTARRAPPSSRAAREAELDDLLLRTVEADRAMRPQRDAEREAERARESERVRERERAELAAAIAARPEQPSRADVARAVQSIQSDIARCARGETGITMLITFEIEGETGRSRRTTVRGRYAGTPTATCIEAISSIAFFGYFQRPLVVVTYPVRF
jgi:hypothetical protein